MTRVILGTYMMLMARKSHNGTKGDAKAGENLQSDENFWVKTIHMVYILNHLPKECSFLG